MVALPIISGIVSTILTNFVVGVVVDRLAKFGKETQWTQVKIDAVRKARAWMPGVLFDEAAAKYAVKLVTNVELALKDTTEEEKVLKLIAAGKWDELLAEILKNIAPSADVPAAA